MSLAPLSEAAPDRCGRSRAAALRVAGVLGAGGALAVLAAAPALAHDRLERIDPAAGQQLSAVPGQVQLVFDQAVGRRFSTVVVTGPAGAAWTAGPAQVLDGTVTQSLRPGGPAGTYTVAYRIVSADGHPVTGTSSFTVTATGPSPAGAPPPGTQATGAPSTGSSAIPAPGAAAPAAEPPGAAGQAHAHLHAAGHSPAGPLLGGLAVVAVLAGAVWAADRRRRGLPAFASSSGDRP